MKKSAGNKVLGVVVLAASLLAAVGVLTFAGPCIHDDGSVGMCFGASRAVVGFGIASAVLAAVALAAKSGRVQGACAVACAALGAAMAFAPGNVLALCMMQTMRCWTVMRPFALVCGIIVLVAALVWAVLAFRKR